MAKPLVAIVGRPNVGKSTLFNRLTGRRGAIVHDFAGVTRDRNYGDAEWLGREMMVIDTGGMEPESEDALLKLMRAQAEIAIAEADVIIALFDGRDGLTATDRDITRMLARLDKAGKPVHFAVNKIDGARHDPLVAEFWELGVPMLWPISAAHGPGVLDLMEAVVESLPDAKGSAEDFPEGVTRVAVIGKPNAGKSTLVNRLLGQERVLASDVPGTTRDAIDTWLTLPPDPRRVKDAERALVAAEAAAARQLEASHQAEDAEEARDLGEDEGLFVPGDVWSEEVESLDDDAYQARLDDDAADYDDWDEDEGGADRQDEEPDPVAEARAHLAQVQQKRRYLLIDTAGIRRQKWVKTALEKHSVVKGFKSIDRAEVCLLTIDATEGVVSQDARLAGLVQAKGRACVILVNKWDLVPDKDTYTAGAFVKGIRYQLKFISYAPILFVSALTGQRVHRVMRLVDEVIDNYQRRVPTSELNRFIKQVQEEHAPPIHKGRRLKILFATQVAASPPTFLLSVNYKKSMHFSYERYLHNRLRQRWNFEGTPIKLILRERKGRRREDG